MKKEAEKVSDNFILRLGVMEGKVPMTESSIFLAQ